MSKRLIVIIVFLVGLLIFLLIGGYVVSDSKTFFEPIPTQMPTPTLTSTPTPTLTPAPIPTSTPSPLPPTPKPTIITAPNLEELFTKYGNQYNVSPETLKKIASCESGFNPNTVTQDYAGLFQFASFAWTEARGRIGLNNDQNLRFNAEESIRTAAFEINYKGTSGWSDCD